ncbi:MAG: zf-HC2 domain-containing protein [Actinomycetota bacterium]
MSDITQERLDATWRAISFELDAPRPSRIERVLGRVGVPEQIGRIVVATPALRRSWFLALALAALIGSVAVDSADPRSSVFVLLFLAPLAPVIGVALAYGRWADPAHELHVTTPMHGLRLLVIRSVVVLTVSVVVIGGLSLLGDVTRPLAAAWLLPALATTSASAAAMTLTTPVRATTIVGASWVTLAFVGRTAPDDLGAFSPPAQVLAVLVAVGAAAVVWLRREHLDVMAADA